MIQWPAMSWRSVEATGYGIVYALYIYFVFSPYIAIMSWCSVEAHHSIYPVYICFVFSPYIRKFSGVQLKLIL